MNNSELLLLNNTFIPNSVKSVYWSDIFSNLCTQIDHKLLIAGMFLLTVFTLRMIVIPRAKIGFFTDKDFLLYPDSVKKIVSNIFYYGDSLLETIGLGCTIFIVYLAYVQGLLTTGLWVWISVLGAFVFLAALGELVYYLRTKKRLKTQDNKDISRKNQEILFPEEKENKKEWE